MFFFDFLFEDNNFRVKNLREPITIYGDNPQFTILISDNVKRQELDEFIEKFRIFINERYGCQFNDFLLFGSSSRFEIDSKGVPIEYIESINVQLQVKPNKIKI